MKELNALANTTNMREVKEVLNLAQRRLETGVTYEESK